MYKRQALGLDKMKDEIAQLEKEQTVDGFWDDIANSQKVVQRTSNLKSKANEATKNLREPLQKGQTNPKDARQQQQQEKPQKKTGKCMKM